jgi:hypothetical protein
MRRTLLAAALALVGILLPFAPGAHAGGSTANPAAMENDFVSRINALRASKGLGALQVDAELTGIARSWSAKMAQAGTISHNPNFAGQVHANWVKLGENVGVGPDVPSLFQAFVNSPHHYENLVDPAFTRVGVGVVVTSNGTLYTAHQFERLASDSAPAVAAAPARAPAASAPAAPAPSASAPEAAPAVAAAPAPAPEPAPVVPARIALSLEQLRGQAPGL